MRTDYGVSGLSGARCLCGTRRAYAGVISVSSAFPARPWRPTWVTLSGTMALAAGRALCALLVVLGAARAESSVFTRYTSQDGLAYDRVLRIVRDSRGFLWFCTGEGLSRFDGQRFRTFGIAEGLPAAFVADLLESRDGSYWVATDGGGVARYDPDAPAGERPFTAVSVGADPASSKVSRLAQDAGGALWAGTMGGLFRLDRRDGHFLSVPLRLPGVPDLAVRIWALAPAADGTLWVGHDHGLSRVFPHGAGPEHFAIQPTPAGDNVWDLRFDRGGRLWIAHEQTITALVPVSSVRPGLHAPPAPPTAHRGLPRPPWTRLLEGPLAVNADGSLRIPVEEGQAVRYGREHGLIAPAAGATLAAADGTVWIANKGLSSFDGKRIRSYTTAHGLPDSSVICLGEDREGAIWMGTRTRGAVKLGRYDLENRSVSDAPGDEGVTSFLEDAAGAVYAVSPAGRMRRFDANGGVSTLELPVPRALRAPVPLARPGVLRSRDGGWWIATAAGLTRLAPMPPDRLAYASPLAVYTTRDGLGGDAIGILHEDRGGNIWIGHARAAERPLSRWSPVSGTFRAYGADDGVPAHDTVSAIVEDAAGRLFVGFAEGGVARREGERFTVLPGLDPAEIGGVFDLYFDSSGRLWIATSRAGLRRVTDPAGPAPRLDAFTAAQGLASNSVRALVDDQWGRLYALTTRGIDCLDPHELRRWRRFTTAHGVRNYFFLAAFRDSRGRLWFGSREGVTRLTPERWLPALAPVTLLEGLQVSGVRLPVAAVGQRSVGPLRLAHDQNNLQVEFLALDFGGEPTRFRHRLDGVDEEWSAPSAERTMHYGRLAPGDYVFRVAAEAPDASEAEVRFSIQPPPWARPWFRATAAAALIALATVAYRVRVGRLVAMERVRTRIASDLHDDIGSSLSQIAVLGEVVRARVGDERPEVAEQMSLISSLSREAVDAMSDIVWAINPAKDHLPDLAHRIRRVASDLLPARGIDFDFHVEETARDPRLGADVRREVFLVFKEALNNAVRHSGCARMTIDLRLEGGGLKLTVSDDGRGLDPAASAEGHGLLSMRRRAEQLGGTLELVTGPGTRVTLRVPVR
jgi:signal transduction histidine kinase